MENQKQGARHKQKETQKLAEERVKNIEMLYLKTILTYTSAVQHSPLVNFAYGSKLRHSLYPS